MFARLPASLFRSREGVRFAGDTVVSAIFPLVSRYNSVDTPATVALIEGRCQLARTPGAVEMIK
jgi:hypothetical protein